MKCYNYFIIFFSFIFFYSCAPECSSIFEVEPTSEKKEKNNQNEITSSDGDLSGSAPFTITFYSNAKDNVDFVEWIIEKPDTSNIRFTTRDSLVYTFKIAGTYNVNLIVTDTMGIGSDDNVIDERNFEVKVSESFLDCPNYFNPKSTTGNNEFKVSYKSIISFHGIIINRWGQKMFEWSNPANGWNGKYEGKYASPGVYFYIIEAVGSDGIKYNKKGDINLL